MDQHHDNEDRQLTTRHVSLEAFIRSLLENRSRHYASPFVVSAVGGGGKTTTLVHLYQQSLRPRSILTTTTAMIAPGFHDDSTNPCLSFRSLDSSLRDITMNPPSHSGVWFGEPFSDIPGKYRGVDVNDLDTYVREQRSCRNDELIIYCEADGSKRKPLKAHADHEPVIPLTTDLTLILFGCSGIDRALSEANVHRAELFAKATSKQLDDRVEFEDLTELLRNGHLLKGIPATSRVAVIFNQIDLLPKSMSEINKLEQWAKAILSIPRIDAIFFTGGAGDEHDTILGVAKLESDAPRFSAVLLAAGLSTRMGTENKLLLPLGDKTVLAQTLSRVLSSDIGELVIVLGHEASKVKQSIAADALIEAPSEIDVKIVFNEDYEQGQGTSVACGVRHLADDSTACFFIPGDQPFVSPLIMRALAESSAPKKIVIPTVGGKRTSPVLFDRAFYRELAQLRDERGGRQVIETHEGDAVVLIQCDDELSSLDLDTREMYEKARNMVDK